MIVERVETGSQAARCGLKPGDSLASYQGYSPPSLWAFLASQENAFERPEAVLEVCRAGERLEFMVTPEPLGAVWRCEMPDDLLAGYGLGLEAFEAARFAEAADRWAGAAAEADGDVRAFLHGKAGSAWERIPEWARARDAYLAAYAAAEGEGDAAAQSFFARSVAACLHRLNDNTAAEDWYERTRARDEAEGRPRWAAQSLFQMGCIAFNRDDHVAAGEAYGQGLAIMTRHTPESLEAALCLSGVALVFSRTDYPQAERLCVQAAEMAERVAPDTLGTATVFNQAVTILRVADLAAAQSYAERAAEITARHAPDSLDHACSLSLTASLHEWRGEMAAAQKYQRQALHLRERFAPGSREVAISHNDLANPLNRCGDLPAARYHLKRALEVMEALSPGGRSVAEILSNLGNQGDDPDGMTAEECYTRSLEILERVEPDSTTIFYPCANLGGRAFARGDLDAAEAYFRRALALSERISPDAALTAYPVAGLFDVARAREDWDAAQAYLARIVRIRERTAPDSLTHAETLYGCGDMANRRGALTEARDYFLQTVAILERRRGELESPNARALLMHNYQEAYAALTKCYVKLGDLAGAFYTIERARGRSFLELLAERDLDFSADAAPELLEQQRELDRRRAGLYQELSGVNPIPETRARIDSLHAALQRLEREREQLAVEMRAASPRYATLRYPEPLGLEAARRELEPGTLLLSYLVGEKETTLLTVAADEAPRAYLLPFGDKELQDRVDAFRRALDPRRLDHRPAELLTQARQLYRDLLRPAHREIRKAERLLICPNGPLHTLPFAALVTNSGRPPRFLGAEKAIHSILSVTVYAQARKSQPAERQTPERVLVMGDPLYQTMPDAEGGADAAAGPPDPELARLHTRGLSFKPLPNSREEALHLARLFGDVADVRLGAEATKTAVLREAPAADLVHFACHGWMDAQTPLSSGLAFSQPEALGRQAPPDDNGLLQVWEILQKLRLKADLVTLSACQTGLGHEIRGEGLVGLTRAFLYAGARSLLVCLLDVNDAATARFMQSFYAALQAGGGKDESLRAGVRALQESPEWDHPFYWSAFLLVGDRN